MTKKKLLVVKVQTKASQNKIVTQKNGQLKVYVTTPPEKGKANKKVLSLLSKHFDIPISRLKIVRGTTSSIKYIEKNN